MAGLTLKQDFGTFEEENLGFETNITAHTGGGQANAYQLTKKWSIITVATLANDSVKLLAAQVGLEHNILNVSGNTVKIYPQVGEYLNGVLNGSLSILPNQNRTIRCYSNGTYNAVV